MIRFIGGRVCRPNQVGIDLGAGTGFGGAGGAAEVEATGLSARFGGGAPALMGLDELAGAGGSGPSPKLE